MDEDSTNTITITVEGFKAENGQQLNSTGRRVGSLSCVSLSPYDSVHGAVLSADRSDSVESGAHSVHLPYDHRR